MKPIPLQLVTVKLDNGQQGIFIGSPLLNGPNDMQDSQVSEIWFSDVRDLPDQIKLEELMQLVHAQLSNCRISIH
ncbi:MAG: hypothetical protein PVG75_02300 [Thioalkalispiraceae bacterium]|jgi:hypothetical protein